MRTKFISLASHAKCMIAVFTLIASSTMMASDRVVPASSAPQGWDNTGFAFCYYNGKNVMNLNSVRLCSPGKVFGVKMSPTMTTFAALYDNGTRHEVGLFSQTNGQKVYAFRMSESATAVAFSANAKWIYIATDNYAIHVYDLASKSLVRDIRMTAVATNIAVSDNNYFVAGVDAEMVYVYNSEAGRVRKVIEVGKMVNWVEFSKDNSIMAVLTENGDMLLYDTKTFTVKETYTNLGDARCCSFHPEGKYVSVITGVDKITVINMKNPDEREEIVAEQAGINHVGYARQVRQPYMLAYNTVNQFVFHALENLVPDYQQLVADEVESQMDEWMKMMPGESMEEYQLRVNEETRAAQYAAFENAAATALAGNMVQEADVSFGSYNQDQSMLEVNFDNMPSIYLDVPQEDVADFSNPEKLSFENSVYGVGENDQFELLYTEVLNTETGKKYVFDNLAKQKLDYMASDDNFVPLDLIQQSSMEEIKLQEIREQVVTEAKSTNRISEHTHIDVKTKVEASTDADGNKIMNYNVDFNYNVEPEFSAAEDFKPGKYNVDESASASAMLNIMKKAFSNEFKQYIQAGKKVQIIVTGAADATPIKSKLAYKNEYGTHTDVPVKKNGEITGVSLSEQGGILTNDQLAFARALSVQNYVVKNLTELSTMQTEYDYTINVSNERGAEFRRIGIRFVFIDAFNK